MDDSGKFKFEDKTSIIQSETFKVKLAQAGKAPPCVVLLMGPASLVGRTWPIEDTNLVVGRSLNSNISVEDKSVSKSHAKIVLAGGDVSIIDLESTNRTVVNGRVLQPLVPFKLQNNDQIKTGNVIFKYLEQGNIETVSVAETFDRGLTDALTGINNKGALEQKGIEAIKKADLLGIPLSVIVFDIDHFKRVNDTYGHLAGDYILKELTKVVGENLIREDDFFARCGGEEFCLLLLGGNINHASDIAERVRLTIEGHNFTFEGVNIPITVSAGVATRIPEDKLWEQIFERSDKALYESKNSGRNKITIAK